MSTEQNVKRPSGIPIDAEGFLRGRAAWALLLLVAYLATQIAGWRRTLIDTEIWALYHAARPWSEQLQSIREDLVHPPLMYLIQRFWVGAFGQSDDAVKALALVINLPTFFLFTWLASRVTPYWRLASFLFAANYFRVGSLPTLLRMYGLGLLLTVAALVVWEKWRESPRNTRLLGWTVIATLLVYTHLFGSLILLAFVIANWLFGPRRAAFTTAATVAGSTILPWSFYVLPVYDARGLYPNLTWVNVYPIRALAELPAIFMLSPVFPLPGWRLVSVVVAGAVLLLLFLLAWRAIRRIWPPQTATGATERWFWTGLLLAGVPILVLFFFSELVTPAFHARFVFGVVPAHWLVVVLLGQFGGRAGRVVLYWIVLPWVLVGMAGSWVLHIRPSPARLAAGYLTHEMRADDLLLCVEIGAGNQIYWEWKHRLGRTGRVEILQPRPEVARLSVLPPTRLNEANFRGVDRVWVLSSETTRVTQLFNFLSSQNFVLEKRYPTENPFILGFARASSP